MPEELIHRSDDILGGTPVFAGTRVPVQTMFDYLAAGDGLAEFLDDFPAVSREHAVNVLDKMREQFPARDYDPRAGRQRAGKDEVGISGERP